MKRLLTQALPAVKGVIAYCDPIERRSSDGTLVKRGHVGTIYKATNSQYRGRSSARTLWLAPTGGCLVERMLSKIRSGVVGEAYAMDHLRKLGVPQRERWVSLAMSISSGCERLAGCAPCATRAIWHSHGLCRNTVPAYGRRAPPLSGLLRVRRQFRNEEMPAAPTAPASRRPSAENIVGVPVTLRRWPRARLRSRGVSHVPGRG